MSAPKRTPPKRQKPPPMRGIKKRSKGKVYPGDQRCTPEPIWRAALEAIGQDAFDLDPATNAFATVPARTRLMGRAGSSHDDGLLVPWFGDIFLNFPFSDPPPWVEKAIRQWLCGPQVRSIQLLGPGDTSVKWWQRLVGECHAWAAWPKRLHFPLPGKPKGSPPAATHLFYFGEDPLNWRRVMERHGCITYPRAVRLGGPR